MASTDSGPVLVREVKEEDGETLAHICFNAFKQFNESVSAPLSSDFESIQIAVAIFSAITTGARKAFGIVAVDGGTGQLLGSGFLHHDAQVYSIGPVSVAPDQGGKGVGKAIMTSLINRAKDEHATSIRLVQGTVVPQQAAAAAHALGFAPDADADVRVMEDADVNECADLFKKVMGYGRLNRIRRSVGKSSWVVYSKSGGILAYTTGFTVFGHTVAASEEDFVTLFLGVTSKAEHEIHLNISSRLYPRLAQWALASKLTLMRHKWYMVIGEYKIPEERFVYLPNVLH